jgi:putative sporulation protein YtaF
MGQVMLMHLFSILLFALSANIDNFTVGAAYGIKKIKIGNLSNLIIAIISSVGTLISMTLGLVLSSLIPQYFANIIGNVILIAIGLWFLKNFVFKNYIVHKSESKETGGLKRYTEILDEPEKADADSSGDIDIRETFILAFALTINNFGLGIGASIAGFNIALTTVCTFIFSLLLILLGYRLGKGYLSAFFGKYAELISGIIIIALGLFEMFF